MPLFRRRQPLRRWAAWLLLCWLFGVGVGVANACLAVPGAAVSAHEEPCHGQPGSAAKANCQDFCDKASLAIPALKTVFDGIQGPALAPPPAPLVLPVAAPVPLRAGVPRHEGAHAPPIPIAFLRLAL